MKYHTYTTIPDTLKVGDIVMRQFNNDPERQYLFKVTELTSRTIIGVIVDSYDEDACVGDRWQIPRAYQVFVEPALILAMKEAISDNSFIEP